MKSKRYKGRKLMPDGGKIYANSKGQIGGPVKNKDGTYTLPVTSEGLPHVVLPEVGIEDYRTTMGESIVPKNPYSPIQLSDFSTRDDSAYSSQYAPDGTPILASGRVDPDYTLEELVLGAPQTFRKGVKYAADKTVDLATTGANKILQEAVDTKAGQYVRNKVLDRIYPRVDDAELFSPKALARMREDGFIRDKSGNYLSHMDVFSGQDPSKKRGVVRANLFGGKKYKEGIKEITGENAFMFSTKDRDFSAAFAPKNLESPARNRHVNRLFNFHFMNNNPVKAGKTVLELLDKVPSETYISPGSLSGDSYPLWANILNKKTSPNDMVFYGGTTSFNSLGKYSSLSKDLKAQNYTLETLNTILDPVEKLVKSGKVRDMYTNSPLTEVDFAKLKQQQMRRLQHDLYLERPELNLYKHELGGTMKYKGRKKLVTGGEIKLASAAMQANQLGINTLGAAQAQILGDSETDAQRISRESMSKFGKFGVAGLPLAMMDANREMKEFNRERDSYLQAQSLDYSKAARGTFRQGGTMQPGDLTYYEGLTHEEGGIPIGTDHEVEHGETSYKAPDGQRVFSEKNGYAKLSKRIERDAAMRPEDSTAQAIKEARLNRLFAKQEREKMLKEEMLSTKEGAKAYQMMRKGGRIKYSEGDIIPLKPLDINSYMPQVPQLDFIDSVPPMVQKYGPSLEWAPNTNSTPKASNPNFTTPPTTVTTSPSPSLGVSPWGNQLQPGAGYNNKVANPGFSVSKEDLKEMIGIDDTYASMGQAAQLAGPLAQGAITAADRDRYKFRQMDRTKLDTETAPNIYKQQLREQMAAMRQAIRRSTGNVGQYLGAMLASGKKGVEGARGAAVLAADLANKQAAMDFQREGANTDIINKQRMLNQGRRDMRRQNYIKSAEGVGTRTAGMVKDDLKYDTDLAMAAMQLGALDGEFHNLAWETNPDGSKKGLKITRQ